MKLIGDFNEIPTLGFLTATRVIITLWNRADIVRSITRFLNQNSNVWLVDNEVLEIFYGIEEFTNDLKNDLVHINIEIGKLIRDVRMAAFFSPYLENFYREFPVDHWTPYGTVDLKPLEKLLLEDSSRNIGFRYILACNGCYEEYIMELFSLLTESEKLRYIQMDTKQDMRVYWTRRIAYNVNLNLPLPLVAAHYSFKDKSAFKLTLRNGNKSGIEYFMNRFEHQNCLTIIKKKLDRLLNLDEGYQLVWKNISDALYFLLSRLPERSCLTSFHFDILSKFLIYPFFGLFNKCRADWVVSLSREEIFKLLGIIAAMTATGRHLFGYELFDDFWHNLSVEEQLNVENSLTFPDSDSFDSDDSDGSLSHNSHEFDQAIYEQLLRIRESQG